jgi:hypothetical protein
MSKYHHSLQKKAGRPRKGGRPEKIIDWALVDEMIVQGETQKFIADYFCIDVSNFIAKFQKEHNTNFTNYFQSKREEGLRRLRKNTFNRALMGHVYSMQHLNKHMRGEWDKAPDKEPDEQKSITLEQELLKTQYELLQLKEQLGSLLKQTGQELQRSDSAFQCVGGSDQLGKDSHINQEADRTAEEWSQGGCVNNRSIEDYDPA